MYTFNNKKQYNEFIKYLKSISEEKYKKFNASLIPNSKKMYGIRTPILKNISKEISKNDYKNFIKYNTNESFEETMIYGLILGYIKVDFKSLLDELDIFMPFNDNWAINDIVCANLKIFKKNREEGFIKIKEYLDSDNPWKIRFALVLLLDHYMTDDYIDEILDIAINVKNDEYYVKIANSWLISVCFVKYKDKTKKIFINRLLDKWTNNKAIQKIRESYRVNEKDKEELVKLKY